MGERAVSDVTIKGEGISGFGTVTTIDGRTVKGLQAIDLHIGLDEANTLALSGIIEAVEVSATAEVVWEAAIGWGSPEGSVPGVLRAEGATLSAAVRALADLIEKEEQVEGD